jgi:hypothetical protein
MKKNLQRILNKPFFLFAIGIFPVLFLYGNNLGQTSINSLWPSLILAVGICLLISFLCILIVKPINKAYLLSLFMLLMVFTYGHLLNLFKGLRIDSLDFGKNSIFLPFFLIVNILGIVIILIRPTPKKFPHVLINILILSLCIFQLGKIAYFHITTSVVEKGKISNISDIYSGKENEDTSPNSPDIYYIIIDGLLSDDVLKNEYGMSNYNFSEELRKRGFQIPDCAYSNYDGTARSLASTLNMDYLDTFGIEDSQINTDENDPFVLFPLLHQNKVREFLKTKNYQFLSFRGFFPLNDFKDADIYFNYFENKAGYDELEERNFRSLFMQTTFLVVPKAILENRSNSFSFLPQLIFDIFAPDAKELYSRSYQWYRQDMYQFEKLSTIPKIPGKKFIYSHFYTTHQPYVLTSDGDLLWPINEDNNGYVNAVKYTTKRLLTVIDKIIADSEIPPIIIVQADHGRPGKQELDEHKIINAYYLPGSKSNDIYRTITPVNTFRVLFNEYFGQHLPKLQDKLLISQKGKTEFVELPVECK